MDSHALRVSPCSRDGCEVCVKCTFNSAIQNDSKQISVGYHRHLYCSYVRQCIWMDPISLLSLSLPVWCACVYVCVCSSRKCVRVPIFSFSRFSHLRMIFTSPHSLLKNRVMLCLFVCFSFLLFLAVVHSAMLPVWCACVCESPLFSLCDTRLNRFSNSIVATSFFCFF